MLSHVKITDRLYIVSQEVKKAKSKSKPSNINHIWIYDRSGSMSGVLNQLARDLIARAREIPVGDTITLGWFSGEGSFNFMLKGFKVTEKRDYKILEDTINANKSYLGTTCFSEILSDTNNVIKDLSAISKSFAMCFFTDGYPVVSNYEKELTNINAAIDAISGKVTSSLMVGYGNYYNKELMSNMASKLGGSLCHSSDLPQFAISLQEFVEGSRGSSKTMVDVDPGIDGFLLIPFSINKKQINVYEINDIQVNFNFGEKDTDNLYYITNIEPNNSTQVDADDMIKAAYAASYILTQRTKTSEALEVLAAVGDVELIDAVANAYTNEEYGRAEKKIQENMASPTKRFAKGRDTNYLPPADAFCLLDLLHILALDEKNVFYPLQMEYNRITVASEKKGDYPDFEGDRNSACNFSSLTWNDSKLNLSIRAKINGHIDLGDDAHKYGFSQKYPTYVWRNYTVVKDGFLNLKQLKVSLTLNTIKQLPKGVFIPDGNLLMKGTLDLSAVPVINRMIAEGKTSAKKLCDKVIEELELMAELKVLREYKDRLDTGTSTTILSDKQQAFLEGKGINPKSGAFSPPTERGQATDWYMAKEFDIKVKGFSSFPKVSEVEEKIKAGADLKPSAKMMESMVRFCKGKSLPVIEEQIETRTKALIPLRTEIQKTKFSIILGKRWFDEFTSRENNTIKIKDKECSISLREVKVEV